MKFLVLSFLSLMTFPLAAQELPRQLSWELVEDFFQIPDDIWLAEAVGVDVNAEGNIFILNRGNIPLLEFTPEGEYVRSYGEGSPIFHAAHSVRFDREDNMWIVDSANNLVVRVSPNGVIEQTLGRRLEPWVTLTHGPAVAAIPSATNFYHPTDVAVAPDGSTYVADGYGNSRIAHFSKEGNLLNHWGERGTQPGQFNTPHSLVIDDAGNIYVADRANNRVQTFDLKGNFLKQWNLREVGGGDNGRASQPWALCITPGPDQAIYIASVGRIMKFGLDGEVLGVFGRLGRLPGYFDWVHAIACPDENTLYVAQEVSFRFDKVIVED